MSQTFLLAPEADPGLAEMQLSVRTEASGQSPQGSLLGRPSPHLGLSIFTSH